MVVFFASRPPSTISAFVQLRNFITSSSSSRFSHVYLSPRAPLHSNNFTYFPRLSCVVSLSSLCEKNSKEEFLAEEGVSWKSLGVSDLISKRLSSIGLARPSVVQAACIPHVLSGDDVVVAAETGSGKTHGYLVPVIDKLYDINRSSTNQPHQVSLVLCPNTMLCEQVVNMCNCLRDVDGTPLVKINALSSEQGWPVVKRDIVVSTPAALLNCLFAFGMEKKRTNFLRGVKHVVFDEADLLLCGSFQNQVIRLINLLRFEEKSLSSSGDSNKLSEDSGPDDTESFESLSDLRDVSGDDSIGAENCSEKALKICRKGNSRKSRKEYARSKQYIFVAATLPANGKKTAGGILKKMFPSARWVSGRYLHYHNPRLKHQWVEVTTDTQVDALVEAVSQGLKGIDSLASNGGEHRVMVFVNTMGSVESVANILLRTGIKCFTYHRDKSPEVRIKDLTVFREQGGVLVCTDAAARGLDIPNISCVIQAEFAGSAVDFLHRVGRTGRAGQEGQVTSFYTQSNKDLVAAVRRAAELGHPLEEAFSRKRSFRKKLKKGLRNDEENHKAGDMVLA